MSGYQSNYKYLKDLEQRIEKLEQKDFSWYMKKLANIEIKIMELQSTDYDEKAFEFIGCTNKECLSNCCNQLKKRIKKLENFMPDVFHDFEKRIDDIERRLDANGIYK